jgi:hypothetical protein
MPRRISMTVSVDEFAQAATSRHQSQRSDGAYLVSVGVVAAVVIGVFFGIGFFLLAQPSEQIIDGPGPRDRAGVEPLSSGAQSIPIEVALPPAAAVASPLLAVAQMARDDLMPEKTSSASGALSSAEAPAVRSVASEATLGPSAAVPPPESASGIPVATTPSMPSASPPLTASVAELLARGDSFVLIGDLASARTFYERAVNAGDARAAVRMGATFDPVFLRRAGLRNTLGDLAQARSWYRRASGIGAGQAERRYGAETK